MRPRARRALLLLGGELRGRAAARRRARGAAVVCADGGARHAASLGLSPRLIVGDLDSISPELRRRWPRARVRRDPDPSRCDLEKALEACRRLGAREVAVAGALGGDLGHSLANLAVLESAAAAFRLVLLDGAWEAILLGPGVHRPPLRAGERFSLVAAPRTLLSLEGADYRLDRERLFRGGRGVGNRSRGGTLLRVSSGRVWLAVRARAR